MTLATRAGGVGIWDNDLVNNMLVWDEQMFRLYGIAKDQFGGAYEAWLAGLHPEDRQRMKDLPHQILDLKSFVKSGDTEGSARQAHSIRGASASVGGERLRSVATEMEMAADAGDLETVSNRMTELEEEFYLLSDELRTELSCAARSWL